MTHTGPLTALAIPFGLAAIGIAGLAVWSIRRAPTVRRGRGLAIAGAVLGAVTTVVSFLVLVGMFLQQLGQEQRRRQTWDQGMQTQRALSRNPMPEEPAANFTSNLPIAILETGGRSISRNERTVVRAKFFDVQNQRASIGAPPDYEGLGTINLRGNTSLHLAKRSYTFHTVDSQNKQTKVSLLGMPPEEDWVLYAPFEDKTLIRDVLAFELANKMGHYAPRTRYVELFICATDGPVSLRDYTGIYVLVEKIKRGKDRVNIAKLEPQHRTEPDITGGYIVKRDHSERRESRFHTAHGGPYFYVSPKAEEITSEQKSWLARYFNAFESALYGDDFKDPQTGYAAYLDVDAFI
ncbi:MAG: CotH kinase family protein, partial [Dehalococcoidia bacterium]|nr:CotH kinase family protein [Dehalococcoidia bacterium]